MHPLPPAGLPCVAALNQSNCTTCCSVNVFGPNEYGEASDIMDAWVDCVEELAYRKVATNITDMKMVSPGASTLKFSLFCNLCRGCLY